MRAFGELWDEITRDRYGVKNAKYRLFRYGVQVNSLGLTEEQPENNAWRILIEALGVTLSRDARCRALQLPTWNEALSLPRPWDQQWSLRLQQILAYETDLLEYPDLFDGLARSIAAKVASLKDAAYAEIARIDELGGALAAIESGYMKTALVRSQAERLARINRGEHGGRRPEPLDRGAAVAAPRAARTAGSSRSIRASAAETLEMLRATQAPAEPGATSTPRSGGSTTTAAARREPDARVDRVRARRGSPPASGRTRSARSSASTGRRPASRGSASASTATRADAVRARAAAWGDAHGGRPRIVVGKPGLDGHSNGSEMIAVAARDAGFEVIYGGIRWTVPEIVALGGRRGRDRPRPLGALGRARRDRPRGRATSSPARASARRFPSSSAASSRTRDVETLREPRRAGRLHAEGLRPPRRHGPHPRRDRRAGERGRRAGRERVSAARRSHERADLGPGALRAERALRQRPRRAGRRAARAAAGRAHPRPRLRRRRADRAARRRSAARWSASTAAPRRSRRPAPAASTRASWTGEALDFAAEFDAVFSNAALHWMKRADDGHRRRLARAPARRPLRRRVRRPRLRRARSRRALVAALARRGIDGAAHNPWYFPTVDEYRGAARGAAASRVRSIALIPRPTPLPGDVTGWLETFAESFTARAARRPSGRPSWPRCARRSARRSATRRATGRRTTSGSASRPSSPKAPARDPSGGPRPGDPRQAGARHGRERRGGHLRGARGALMPTRAASFVPRASRPAITSPSSWRTTRGSSRCAGRRSARASTTRRSTGTSSPAEAAYIVNDCGARVLIASWPQRELGGGARRGHAAGRATRSPSTARSRDTRATRTRRRHAGRAARRRARGRADALLVRHDGSAEGHRAAARGRTLRHPAGGARRSTSASTASDAESVYLSSAPLYHSAPINFCMMVQRLGGTAVVMERFDAREALALIERYRVTHSQWVPTMFVRCSGSRREERARFDLSSHRVAIHAAAPCPVHVKEAMIAWWGPILWEYYSATERPGITCLRPDEWVAHRGSVGRAVLGEVHVLDDDGSRVRARRGRHGLLRERAAVRATTAIPRSRARAGARRGGPRSATSATSTPRGSSTSPTGRASSSSRVE